MTFNKRPNTGVASSSNLGIDYRHGRSSIGMNFQTGTTASRCQNGHQWTFSGSIYLDLEGMPCDCGEMIFHREECPCCKTMVQKHLPKNK